MTKIDGGVNSQPSPQASRVAEVLGGAENPVPNWTPRFWHSMKFGDLMRLWAEGRFRISRSRWLMALLLLLPSLGNSVLGATQSLLFARKLRRTSLAGPPLIIIGHFRAGTTHLYELLACDDQFAYPTMYECFAPNHFLLTGSWLPKLLGRLLPAKRPMDNMAIGLDRPQEDEFALLGLGAPTLYRRLAFPNESPPPLTTPTTATSSGRRLRAAMFKFYRDLTLKKNKPLLLKSPLHTGRIPELIEMFPEAKFLHIVRHPEQMFPSLEHTWRLLDRTQAFQEPAKDLDYRSLILDTFDAIYEGFTENTAQLPSPQYAELRYEDLIKNPLNELQRVYASLELGGFEKTQPKVNAYLQSLSDYRPNTFAIDEATRTVLANRWAWYYQRYDYRPDQPVESRRH